MQLDDRPEKSIFSIDLVKEEAPWEIIRETAIVQLL